MTDITAEIITLFRTQHPSFQSVTVWPDTVVTSGLCEGDVESGGAGWGAFGDECSNFKQRGMFFYAAHWLLSLYPSGATDPTAESGAANFAVNSKSVGDESITFNNGNLSQASVGDASLASTKWGQQFMRLRKRAGMGARVV